MVPAHADSETELASGQDVYLGGLLGHQRGLALAQDQHRCHQFKVLGDGCCVAIEHHWFVEHVPAVVGPSPVGPMGEVGAQHMVEYRYVVVSQLLGCLEILAHSAGVGADLRLGKNDSKLHE